MTVNFIGTVTTPGTPVSYTNTIAVGAVGVATPGIVSQAVSASLLVVDDLRVLKSAPTPSNPAPGNPVRYQVTVQNFSNAVRNNVAITDDFANGQTFLTGTIGGIDYTPSVSAGCGAVTTPAAVGAASATFTIGGIPARASITTPSSCTVTFWAMTDPNAGAGAAITNAIANGGVTYPGIVNPIPGATSTPSGTLDRPVMTVAKAFAPSGPMSEGSVTRLTITLTNRSANPISNASISDPLPTNGGVGRMRVASPANAATSCGAGTVTAVAGTSSVTMNGGTVPARANAGSGANGSCTVQVDVLAPAGSYTNTVNASGTETLANGLTRAVDPVSATAPISFTSAIGASKTFNPASVSSGGKSTVTVRVNNSGAVALTGVAITDPLPAGMVLASPPAAYSSCAGPVAIGALAGQVGEVAGNAARAELRHEGNGYAVNAFAARSERAFNNPASAFNGGRLDAGIRAHTDLSERWRLYGEVLRSEDRVSGAQREGAQLGLLWRASDRLNVDFALRTIHERNSGSGNGLSITAPLTAPLGAGMGGSIFSGNAGGFFGNGLGALDPATGLPLINSGATIPTTSTLGGGGTLDATTLRVGASYRLDARWTLRAEGEVGIAGEAQHRAALGADYQISERARAYGRYEAQRGLSSLYSLSPSSRSSAFVAGVETDYMQGGQLFSEYRLRDAISAQDVELASGVRNVWDVSEGLRLSTSAERLSVLSGAGQQATALAAGADWFANPLWRVSGRLEWRRTGSTPALAGADGWLSTLSVARKLDRDWTLLARNYLLLQDNRATGDLLQERFQIGLAYRDTDTNRVNALGRYEYKLERDDSVNPRNQRAAHILSTHADYHPSRPWWWTGRFAAKSVREDIAAVRDSYSAFLLGGRVVLDFAEKWSGSFMTSVLWSPRGNSRQWAQGVELGYQVQTNLLLALGVNWSGFQDRDLSASDYTRKGVYLRLRWKFDEDLLRGGQPATNRTLDRDR